LILNKLPALALVAALACGTGGAWAQKVKLATSLGDITVELDAEKAPKTVDNFLQYVKAGHYDAHRVPPRDRWLHDPGRWLQAGPATKAHAPADPAGKPQRAVECARHHRDGPHGIPDSATSQFFINVNDNLPLDQANSRDGHGYAVFGKVVAGMDVVDKIKALPTQAVGMHQNMPVTPVLILKASVEK
jgi:peptidyl-prolyl cis-trans isomerase A (cyclophilin A)